MSPRSPLLESLAVPVVQAPMAGGPSTPALAAGVNRAGGLGFLAAGYLTPDRLREGIAALGELTDRPFGVNVFAAGPPVRRPDDPERAEQVRAYAVRLEREAARAGVELGAARVEG